jgi:hypothetical protein
MTLPRVSGDFRGDGSELLTLAMKIIPPAIKQKAVISSDGGLEGRRDVGGDR